MRRPSAGGGAGELELWFAMAPMVAFGPPPGLAGDGIGGDGRRGGRLPVGLALPRSVGLSEGVVAAVNLVSHALAPFLFYLYSASNGSPPAKPYMLDTPD